MRIILFASGEFGQPSLRWLTESSHELVEIVTQPARPAGRGRKSMPTPIAQLAGDLGLSFCQSPDVNAPVFVEQIRSLQPDVIIVIAFGQKIGDSLLNMSDCRVINLHGSLLPKYRGAAPINWAIINGERQSGLSIIELDERWDGGAVLGLLATDITPGETAGELHDRLALLGPVLLEEVLGKIARNEDSPLPQDDTLACRAPKLSKLDGAIDWTAPAERICNRICGMFPWPGAFCYLAKGDLQSERLVIARAEVALDGASDEQADLSPIAEPGVILENGSIACGAGSLRILQLCPAGGKLMDWRSFVNGRRLVPGDRLSNG